MYRREFLVNYQHVNYKLISKEAYRDNTTIHTVLLQKLVAYLQLAALTTLFHPPFFIIFRACAVGEHYAGVILATFKIVFTLRKRYSILIGKQKYHVC